MSGLVRCATCGRRTNADDIVAAYQAGLAAARARIAELEARKAGEA